MNIKPMLFSELPSHISLPHDFGDDRTVGFIEDRYVVFRIVETDSVINETFSGLCEMGHYLWRVFDGYMGEYEGTGWVNWENMDRHFGKYDVDCINGGQQAYSLVEFLVKINAEYIESIWEDDSESGAGLLTDSQRYEWRTQFTDKEREMGRHPNRSYKWLPQRLRKEINLWVRKKLTCEKCGNHNFHSFRETDVHIKTCMVDNPRLIMLKKRFGLS